MDIPGIGTVTKDNGRDWYRSEPISIHVLGGAKCRIVVEDYENDANKEDIHAAIRNFLAADETVLRAAEPYIYQYYETCKAYCDPDEVVIKSPSDVWKYVRLGNEPHFTRRAYGDKGIYVSHECGCAWEEEHGLQIVFKDGVKVNKVGPYDGHVTNSDAYDDDGFENVVFRLY